MFATKGETMGAGESVFRVGVLGRGTVGGAFAQLLGERTQRIERITGMRPVISGVLSRAAARSTRSWSPLT